MFERLIAFVKEYEARVQEASALFRQHKGLENPAYWRMVGLEQRGFIDAENTIEYHFHGIGCRVILPSGEVDWDFEKGNSIGLSIGFLSAFAKRGTDNFPEFKNFETLNSTFQKAISKGILEQPPEKLGSYTYFLRDNVAK